jgi:hypothetical protein
LDRSLLRRASNLKIPPGDEGSDTSGREETRQ